ncbi:sulfatase-like hydrolase/transferase [Diaphorobacter sp. HDW4B]|uniref:sulfatase-like hydrolase/transferase n=1 Tax=Diaphorobacter sp. HDW4B TaxID=2714925 RepID=UPI001409DCC1|nr:sulfatase-like hydrolase/transferase [Diaphorobacter sp. HDW4B]QIL71169.1 sulfatase-like hydrolase/transferase [Diaphorobacter sp. HDW4B]
MVNAEIMISLLICALGFFWTGGFIFGVAILSEVALGLSSVLTLFDYHQIWGILSLLWEARTEFVIGFFSFVFLSILAYVYWGTRLKCMGGRSLLMLLFPIVTLQVVFSFQAGNFLYPGTEKRSELIFGSSIYFSGYVMKENGKLHNLLSHENVEYIPISHPSAMMQVMGSGENFKKSRRVLLILAESWGNSIDNDIVNAQIAPIKTNGYIENFSQGVVQASGTTAFGEFRELCGKIPSKLNLRNISTTDTDDCWPQKFGKAGYKTIAIHGASKNMYHRLDWYPVLGFSEIIFKENMHIATGSECYSFPGYCDSDIFDIVEEKISLKNNVFMYWLTLNTHMPYDRRDIKDYSEKICRDVYPNGFDERLCNYHNLQSQFFQKLSKYLSERKMTNLEVIIVGDHPPPLLIDSTSFNYFKKNEVPYIRFFVR